MLRRLMSISNALDLLSFHSIMKSMEAIKPQQYQAVVTKKIQLTSHVFQFLFQLNNPSALQFISGQYATFIIDPQTRRQYSLCSDPHDTTHFEIVIDTTPMGPGSKYFLGKNVGDGVMCLAPLGNFGLTDTYTKKVLVATGTGIAPFRSMLLNEVRRSSVLGHRKDVDELVSTNQDLRSMTYSLYWGLRYEDDMYWDTELRYLVGQLAGSQYFMCLSKPTPQWSGLTGHVTDHVLENEKNLQNCEFYLCGNSAMITEMESRLSALNVSKEQIKSDLFY